MMITSAPGLTHPGTILSTIVWIWTSEFANTYDDTVSAAMLEASKLYRQILVAGLWAGTLNSNDSCMCSGRFLVGLSDILIISHQVPPQMLRGKYR